MRYRAFCALPGGHGDGRRKRGERAPPVTVLFADFVGFTRMSQVLDAEEVHWLLEKYFEATDAIVEIYGGSIDKHIGGSIMAMFGAPVAHRGDGARALRAAVDIHRAVAGLG
jgi:class 3 adenylate cyclase